MIHLLFEYKKRKHIKFVARLGKLNFIIRFTIQRYKCVYMSVSNYDIYFMWKGDIHLIVTP